MPQPEHIEHWERVCKPRFEDVRGDLAEIKSTLREMNRQLFVGNGQQSMSVRLARVEQLAHTPQNAPRRLVIDLGKLLGAGTVGGAVLALIKEALR